jgi:plastocyanin
MSMRARSQQGQVSRPKALLSLLALAALALTGCGGGGGSKSKSTASASAAAKPVSADRVTISNFKYQPDSIAIRPGGKVTFTNQDTAPHTATAVSGKAFDTNTLKKGQSATITVAVPGTYVYSCVYHAFMRGTVTVK